MRKKLTKKLKNFLYRQGGILQYCLDCQKLYDLNYTSFHLFASKCEICGKLGIVFVCSNTQIDRQLDVVIWRKPITIQIGRRKNTIFITKFDNLLTNEEKSQWLCLEFIVDQH